MGSQDYQRQKDLVLDFVHRYYTPPKRNPNSFHEIGKRAMNFGVICFGTKKKDGLIRIGKKPLYSTKLFGKYKLEINYIATIDVYLFLGLAVFYLFSNPFVFLFFVFLLVYFFVY